VVESLLFTARTRSWLELGGLKRIAYHPVAAGKGSASCVPPAPKGSCHLGCHIDLHITTGR